MGFKVLITSSLNILCLFSLKDYNKLIKLNKMGNRGTKRQREDSKTKKESHPVSFFF